MLLLSYSSQCKTWTPSLLPACHLSHAISRMPPCLLLAGVRLQRVAERDDERDGEAREADKEGGGRIRLEHVARDHVAVCARGRPARTLSGGG